MNDKAKIGVLTFMICSIAGVVVLAVSEILERDIGRLLGGIDAILSVNASGAGSAISAVGSTYSYPKGIIAPDLNNDSHFGTSPGRPYDPTLGP